MLALSCGQDKINVEALLLIEAEGTAILRNDFSNILVFSTLPTFFPRIIVTSLSDYRIQGFTRLRSIRV